MKLEKIQAYFESITLKTTDIEFLLELLAEQNNTLFDLNYSKPYFLSRVFSVLIKEKDPKYQKLLSEIWNYDNKKYINYFKSAAETTQFGRSLITNSYDIKNTIEVLMQKNANKELDTLLKKNEEARRVVPEVLANVKKFWWPIKLNIVQLFEKHKINIPSTIIPELINEENLKKSPHDLFQYMKKHEKNISDKEWDNYIKELNKQCNQFNWNWNLPNILDSILLLKEIKTPEKINVSDMLSVGSLRNLTRAVASAEHDYKKAFILFNETEKLIEQNNPENLKKVLNNVLLKFNWKNSFEQALEMVDYLEESIKIKILNENWNYLLTKEKKWPDSKPEIKIKKYEYGDRSETFKNFCKTIPIQEILLTKALEENDKEVLIMIVNICLSINKNSFLEVLANQAVKSSENAKIIEEMIDNNGINKTYHKFKEVAQLTMSLAMQSHTSKKTKIKI